MAKGKGKKAWAKIDVRDVEDAHAGAAAIAAAGGPIEELPNDSLFFVDTEKDEAPLKRLTRRERVKALPPTRVDSILQRNPLLKFPEPVLHKAAKSGSKEGNWAMPPRASQPPPKKPPKHKVDAAVYDIWDDEAGKKAAPTAAEKAAAAAAAAAKRPKPPKSRSILPPAVEVCKPGASYNPAAAPHQELLGEAVAVEHTKELKKEIEVIKPPLLGKEVQKLMEQELYYAAQEEGEGDDGDDADDGDKSSKAVQNKKLRKADRNRQLRARDREKEEEERRQLKKQRREIEQLGALETELQQKEEEARLRKSRLEAARQERAKQEPARLGKRKFQPAPIQVLLTEEVTGSIRTLKPTTTLLRDRYKSLQRRELIEPRQEAKFVRRGKNIITYEPGARGEREAEATLEWRATRASMAERKLPKPIL